MALPYYEGKTGVRKWSSLDCPIPCTPPHQSALGCRRSHLGSSTALLRSKSNRQRPSEHVLSRLDVHLNAFQPFRQKTINSCHVQLYPVLKTHCSSHRLLPPFNSLPPRLHSRLRCRVVAPPLKETGEGKGPWLFIAQFSTIHEIVHTGLYDPFPLAVIRTPEWER